MLPEDDVPVTRRGDKDVGARRCVFHRGYFITSHRSLKCVDRVNFCDQDTGAIRPQRLGALHKELRRKDNEL